MSLEEKYLINQARIAEKRAKALEIERDQLLAEVKQLRTVLGGVLPYVATQAVGCHGDKCREPWCISCNGDDEAHAEAAKALAAYQVAHTAWAADQESGAA